MQVTEETIARVVFDANAALNKSLGKHYPSWDEASDTFRAMFVDAVHLLIADPTHTGEMIHIWWMQQMAKDGWIYGPVRDLEKKHHPSMVPFDNLDIIEQVKDVMVANIVDALKPALHRNVG